MNSDDKPHSDEPALAFEGGSENLIVEFWKGAEIGDRNYKSVKDFEVGEVIDGGLWQRMSLMLASRS